MMVMVMRQRRLLVPPPRRHQPAAAAPCRPRHRHRRRVSHKALVVFLSCVHCLSV
eukprot:SAG22_NODE_1852_length_3441_cov_3.839019_5_plen_55_part_00